MVCDSERAAHVVVSRCLTTGGNHGESRYGGRQSAIDREGWTPVMPSAPAPYSRNQAASIRERMLRDAGHLDDPPAELLSAVAREIGRECALGGLKAYRLAYEWTVVKAIEQFHSMCLRDGLGARGLVERSWKEWEAGGRPNDDYRDLLCRLFRTGPVQLGFGQDYTPKVDETTEPRGIVSASIDLRGDMYRRSLLGTSAAIILGSSLGDLEDRLLFQRREGGKVGADTVADLSTIAAAYRRSYRSTPAAQLFAAARAHLDLVASLQPQHQRRNARIPLLSIVGEMAALKGVILLLDQNRPADAQPYIQLAWAAAQESGNSDLQAVVRGGQSFAASYVSKDHQAGLTLPSTAIAWPPTGALKPEDGRPP